MCYVPPSVELLGPTTPQFSKTDPQPPRFQTRLTCQIEWQLAPKAHKLMHSCNLFTGNCFQTETKHSVVIFIAPFG